MEEPKEEVKTERVEKVAGEAEGAEEEEKSSKREKGELDSSDEEGEVQGQRTEREIDDPYYYYRDNEYEEHMRQKKSKCPSHLLTQNGKFYMMEHNYQKAIDTFNIALGYSQDDLELLLERAKCYYHLMLYDMAMQDVNRVLEIEPNYIEALYQKGEVEYILGDFEFAYLSYLRGSKLKPQSKAFKAGMKRCKEAIYHNTGAGTKLRIDNEDVQEMEKRILERRLAEESSVKERQLDEEEEDHEVEEEPIVCRDLPFEILGQATLDKQFMLNHLHGDFLKEPFQSNERITQVFKKAMKFLHVEETMWQNIKPMYSKGVRETKLHVPLSQIERKPVERPEDKCHLPVSHQVKRLMSEAKKAFGEKKYEKSIDICKEVRKILRQITVHALPTKLDLMCDIYHIMGCATFDLGDHVEATNYHERELRIAIDHSMHNILQRALKRLYVEYMAAEAYDCAILALDDILPYATSDDIKSFVYFELANCYLLSDNLDEAGSHAEKSVEFAEFADDQEMAMNATLLRGKIQVFLKNNHAAMGHFEKALKFAEDGPIQQGIQAIIDELKNKLP